MEENTKDGLWKKLAERAYRKVIFWGVVILVLVIVILAIYVIQVKRNEEHGGVVTTISKSTLEKVCEISELSTANYAYNAIATAYAEDGESVRYRVAYEGTVTAGIDFTKLDINVDDENKKILIKVPEVEIQTTSVEAGKMEFIFTDESYNTETVTQEAYEICKADLEKRAREESDLLAFAKENAIATVEALVSPWVTQVDDSYEIEVQ